MRPADAAIAAPGAQVLDLIQLRLQRALRARQRYRYVKPVVLAEGGNFRIQSPCCSRHVDPQGGQIDIALLAPQPDGHWRLCARDHASGTWIVRFDHQPLDAALERLCTDTERQFWP